ncbi:SLBB domain-containing protein [Leptolyngbya sp. GB1-A1]|uniref:SLBB domain-containing protein n=1 Tax=Leptolyngbya sp. GB1-A1 TaxID=2933908 RepID=UPI003296AC1D
MRVSALIQLSALAACPLALLTLNDTGDSRVPSQPASTPTSPETASQKNNAVADLSTTILPPEAYAAEAQGSDRPLSSAKTLTTTANTQKIQTAVNLPEPQLYPLPPSQSSSPSPQAVARQPMRASSPARVNATPERLDVSWDRVIARSVGLDESTFAAVSRASTPPAAALSTAPAQALLPEAAALDPQSANPDPAVQSTTQDTAQADSPATQGIAQADVQQMESVPVPASIQAAAPTSTTAEANIQSDVQSATTTAEAKIQQIDSAPTTAQADTLPAEPAIAQADIQQMGSVPAAPAAIEATQPIELVSAAVAQPTVSAAKPIAQTQFSESPVRATTLPSLPTSPPQPTTNLLSAEAVDQTYRLGPGDAIQVNFFNVPEYSGTQRVLVDGTVNLPAVGNVSVAGLTLAEAEQTIAAVYGRELRNIRVTVGLAQSRPLRVGVAGEVRQPGYYVMASNDAQLPSVAQAIQTAGGVTQLANLRQVQVRRIGRAGTPEIISVNLWALLEQGDLSQNLTLLDGDTIVIAPTDSMNAAETEQLAASNLASNEAQAINISLIGEVGRPGAYKLDSAAGNRATLTQAIQAAGGVTPEADLRKVQVQRSARNGTMQATTLDLWQLVTAGDLSQDLILQPGDRITIAKAEAMTPEEMSRVTGSNVSPTNIRVNIVGEATSPGAVQVPANTTLNQALLAAGGFNRRSRRTVELIRINPNGTLTQRNIEVDWDRPVDPETNPILFNNDVIRVRRNGLASFSDTATSILEPIFRILPVFGLF